MFGSGFLVSRIVALAERSSRSVSELLELDEDELRSFFFYFFLLLLFFDFFDFFFFLVSSSLSSSTISLARS